MRKVEPNVRYESDGGRLLFPYNASSIVLPEGCWGQQSSGLRGAFHILPEPDGIADLFLSTATDALVPHWEQESFDEWGQSLRHIGEHPFAGTLLHQFSANGYVGYKASVADAFRNGLAMRVAGPRGAAKQTVRVACALLASIEFHDPRELSEAQVMEAVTCYLNAPALRGFDSILHLARYPYLLSDPATNTFEKLLHQMRVEHRPELAWVTERFKTFQLVRQSQRHTDGNFERGIAEIRSRAIDRAVQHRWTGDE